MRLEEGAESVIVTLTGATGDADVVLGAATEATVTISDDDQSASAITIEAEDIDIVTGYRIESNNTASGGEMLSLIGFPGNEEGSASVTFGDIPEQVDGTYDILIGTFNENDGVATFTAELTDLETGLTTEIGNLTLDGNLGSAGANPQTQTVETLATGISLTAGDILTINGVENGNEHARLDFINLNPVI